MSSFTNPLIVKKVGDMTWELYTEFEYHVGSYPSTDVIIVPAGFKTDFASVPRWLWWLFPPDGKYTGACVIHDFNYTTHTRSRKDADRIFLESMKVLGVSKAVRTIMYFSVRIFGETAWNKKQE